ncbi:membrane protein [Streptomyces nigrescens]|uniref:Membrane protein n=1 Tax=Streptomyces nigrescens TaxID=1920 RepID=A0ABM7ZSP3_STRNI|nr:acyltransferase family protein [Streptomyces nigrescens]BDM69409.1 membrane protein [Streptomyces nigrescens]
MFRAAIPLERTVDPAPEARQDPAPRIDPKSDGRDPFFDNAKYLAVVLVAMGHTWEPLTHGGRVAMALYMTVYTFHIPAFVLISGYFSRGFDLSPAKLKRLITSVAVPYVVFEVLYAYFQRWVHDTPNEPISLTSPYYLDWFLAALFIWRLTTPLWKLVRWPVPLALVIAVLAAASPQVGNDFAMRRVLQFLPFFVLGLHLKPAHFDLLRQRAIRVAAAPVILAAAVFAYWAAPRMNTAWFRQNNAVQDLGMPAWVSPVMELALFGCALVLTVCFLALVPPRQTWFTKLGAGTLYGYLLHGFAIKMARWSGWYDTLPWVRTPAGEVVVTLLAVTLITLLCTRPVRRVFRYVMEPKMSWAFQGDAAALARTRAGTADAVSARSLSGQTRKPDAELADQQAGRPVW